MKKILVFSAITIGVVFLLGCVSGSMRVTPVYSTKSISSVSGEISLGEVTFPYPGYGNHYSLGAVDLTTRIDYFCKEALEDELSQFGLDINPNARLEISAEVLTAETIWRKQGRGGVFRSLFAIKFNLIDKENGDTIYSQIHEASASHSQSYGGYPASASVVDALSATYDRFLRDRTFGKILTETGSINLYGEERAVEKDIDYRNKIYRDYQEALKDMSTDLLASLESIRYDGIIAIFGFKNKQGIRSDFSLEVEREIRGYLSENRFNVVTRELADILHEQKLQYTGLFDENIRAEIGKFIGATHLISGSLYYYDSDGIIKLRVEVINVETGLVSASFVTNLIASQSYLNLLSK